MTDPQSIIANAIQDPDNSDARQSAVALGIAALPPLADFLVRDQPIAQAERCEALFKSILAALFDKGVTGPQARSIASFQQQIGLLLKYKSYSVKATSPLGYAIFLQNPNQGFSFQEHITHKVEVFHILKPHAGGYVFLCDIDQWNAVYDREAFNAWLQGAADPRYEQFRHPARPGDVFVIDRLRTVHTVMGCVLEEFATVSTDMVNRLHDQNAGRAMPEFFTRAWAMDRLRAVETPQARREVLFGNKGSGARELIAQTIRGGMDTSLTCGDIRISWYDIDPGARTDLFSARGNALSLYVTSGSGRLMLCDLDEARAAAPPSMPVRKGDLFLIPPFMAYGLASDAKEPLCVSAHMLPHNVAFVRA
jgi:hypothetical protein